jgi:hypothetical protein
VVRMPRHVLDTTDMGIRIRIGRTGWRDWGERRKYLSTVVAPRNQRRGRSSLAMRRRGDGRIWPRRLHITLEIGCRSIVGIVLEVF